MVYEVFKNYVPFFDEIGFSVIKKNRFSYTVCDNLNRKAIILYTCKIILCRDFFVYLVLKIECFYITDNICLIYYICLNSVTIVILVFLRKKY